MERPEAPTYAKKLRFEEFVKFINLYIKEYLQRYGVAEYVGNLEATGVIYSKYHNQVWLVGDCKAIYDGQIAQNPLRIDEVVMDIRKKIVEALLQEGYTNEDLLQKDISIDIIYNPDLLSEYIKDDKLLEQVEAYRTERIRTALLECGFSEKDIKEQELIQKYYNPRALQQMLKNNPNMKTFGYAIFNGQNTEIKNCRVVTLPNNVRTIKLFSDGFPVDALNNNEDIGYAVRTIRKRAKEDPLSIRTNLATHTSVRYSDKLNRIEEHAIDDASAVVIEIERDEKQIGERGEE